MTKSFFLKLAAAIIVLPALGFASAFAVNYYMSPKLIYSNGPLPAFSEVQDLSNNLYFTMVRLESDAGVFFCSGTVISDDYVLTAAHCLMDDSFIPKMTSSIIRVVSVKGENGWSKTVLATAAALNTRADYALVKGDFREFTKTRIITDPVQLGQVKLPALTCGFPWGANKVCYLTGNQFGSYYEKFKTRGRLFPGMSGGPVVDPSQKAIFAINSAVGDDVIILSPLVGLFETLGVQVIK